MGFSASRGVRKGIAESLGGQSGDRQYQFNQLVWCGITTSNPASRNQFAFDDFANTGYSRVEPGFQILNAQRLDLPEPDFRGIDVTSTNRP